MHFNLLLLTYLYSRKLYILDGMFDKLEPQQQKCWRSQLFPLHIGHMLIGKHDSLILRFFFDSIVWLTILLIPLLILTWTQLRFLAFHDVVITWSQRGAILLDLLLLWLLWPRIVSPDGRLGPWLRLLCINTVNLPLVTWKRLVAVSRFSLVISKSQLHQPVSWNLLREVVSSLPARIVYRRDILQIWRRQQKIVRPKGGFTLVASTLVLIPFSLLIATIPGQAIETWTSSLLQKHFSQLLTDPKEAGHLGQKSYCLLTYCFFDEKDEAKKDGFLISKLFPRRYLDISEKFLVAGSPKTETLVELRDEDIKVRENARKKVLGINLANRNLKYANFYDAVLVKVDLRNSRLKGANLFKTHLEGADMYGAHLEGLTCLGLI